MPKIVWEFDYFEDSETIDMLHRCNDAFAAIHDAYYVASNRMKHGENVTEVEARVLEEIVESLGEFI